MNTLAKTIIGLALFCSLSAQRLEAGVYYWDPNGLSAPTSGTWNTTSAQWATSSVLTASPVVWNTANAAVFPAGAQNLGTITITVNSTIPFAGSFNGNSLANNTGFGVTNLILSGSGTLSLNSGLQGFWNGSNAWNTIYRVPIAGTGGIQNQSGGSLYLGAANSYSGGFSVGSSGGVNINNGSVFGTGPVTNAVSLTVLAVPATDSSGASFATAPMTITNAWTTFGGSSTEILVGLVAAPVTFTGPWTLAGAAGAQTTLDVRNTTWTINGVIGGNGGLTKINSSGTLVLGGANTYAGTTTNSAGTLKQGAANAIPNGSGKGNIVISSGATFDLGGFDCALNGFGTGSAGIIDNSSGSGTYTLTIGNNNGAGTQSGTIKNSSGTLGITKVGTGAIVLSGTNTFTGKTLVSAGTLTLNTAGGTDAALGTAPASPVADQLTLNGGTLSLGTAASVTITNTRGITLGASGGTISLTSGSTALTVNSIISGAGSLTKAGANNLDLLGANTFQGGFLITGGGVRFRNDNAAGTGTITVTPASTVTLRNLNPPASTTITNPVVLNANGGFDIDLAAAAGATFTLAGNISGTGYMTRDRGTAGNGIVVLSGNNSSWSGGLLWRGSGIALGNPNALGSGTLSFTPANADSVVLSATTPLNALNAVTNVVQVAISNATQQITIAGTNDLELSGPISLGQSGSLSPVSITNKNTGTTILSGPIGGAGFGLTLTATNTSNKLILAGNSTYTGATTINGGTVLVNGSLPAVSSLTVNSGAILGGNGTIHGPATIASGATVAPGASIGTLTFDQAPSLSGTVSMEVNKAAGPVLTSDKLVVNPGGGTLTYGGALVISASGLALTNTDSFDLFDADSFAGSFSSITPATPGPGLAWDTSRLTVDGTIKVICDGSLVASAGPNQNACSGVGVTIGGSPTASGGSGAGYTYSWSPTTGLNDPTLANTTASPNSTTTYTVTVTDAGGCTAQSSVTVSVDVAPIIASQTTNQTACSGSAASFSVAASGSGLNYSWAKISNAGWGSAWASSGNGATFRSSSTDNDFGDTACASFASAFDINSPSGNALGMWGGFSGDEVATRTFAALASGQAVSIDFDNGNVDGGSKVGFSLQTSGGADVLEFYFLGGQTNYKYNDGTENDTGIPFQRTGLRVQFSLTSASTYSLIVTPCGGTATHFTGSYSGTIAQLKLFNQNTTGGNDKNIYFNNFLVGGYIDNADNYSGDYAGQDKGDQPIASGNGGSSYTTPSLTVGDNGAHYQVVVGGCGGAVLSSAVSLTVNAAPTASTGGNQTICAGTSTAGLGGSVGGGATGGTWSSSGTGSFAPDATTLNATYTPSAADITAGTVTLTLTTTGQLAPCTPAMAQVVVTINPAPTASAGGNQTICAGSSTAGLGGSVGGSATGGTWSSSGTGTFSPDATTLNAIYNPSAADISAGTVTLTLTSTGQLSPCAPATAQVVVTINPAATASAGGNQTICSGSSTAGLGGSVGGGATGGTWSSSGTGTFVPNATTLNATYSPSGADVSAGTVTLTLTSTGQLAPCPAATAQVVVTINPAATASTGGNQTICAGNDTAGLGGSVGGGATGGTWSSSGTGTFNPDATTLNATYSPSAADINAGTVTLTLTSSGQLAPCPPATAQVVVTINALPAITSAPTNLAVCAGSPAIFHVGATGAALAYQWQVSTDGGTTFTNISDSATNASYTNVTTALADNGNQYQVIVSGACSPSVTSAPPAVLTVNNPATASASGNQSICAGSDTTGLGGSVGGGATGGTWSSSGTGAFAPDATTLNATYTPSAADISAGTVTLTLTSTGQSAPCPAATAQVIVTINPLPTADAGPDRMICPNRPIAIGGSPTASGGQGPYSYDWSPTAGLSDPTAANPLATISSTTTYTVSVMDANGCARTDSVLLTIAPQPNIQSITNSGTTVTLVWTSVAGQTYRVQYKDDLSDPDWTDLSPDITASGPTASTMDSVGAVTQRFYRVSFVCP